MAVDCDRAAPARGGHAMRSFWGDVNARARGLALHLLSRDELGELAASRDPDELASRLQRAGFGEGLPGRGAAASSLELAVRRTAAARLALMARWCGKRSERLTVIFEDEDRRSLRALLRGAVAGAAVERRLFGLIPTPSLPERALEELARLRTPGEIVAILALWRNPYAKALQAEVGRLEPGLLRLELALSRRYASRAVRAARWECRGLRRYVSEAIDIENAVSALLLAPGSTDVEVEEAFLAGGTHVSRKVFLSAACGGSTDAAASALAGSLQATPYAAPLRRHAGEPVKVERALFQTRLRAWMQEARGNPLSPAPFLAYMLRLRAQVMDLQNIAWGMAIGAPAVPLAGDLVTL
ncbi:MAG: V-type ATPase subunit [Deltaproteobacteria bacterium]|nr:V-type ATPase subunit [Deltaproteobacteria bacterium]